MKIRHIIYILLIYIFISPSPVHSAEPISIDKNFTKKNIGLQIEYMSDKTKELTVDKVSSKSNIIWKKSKKEKLSFGFTKDVYWVRFTVKNNTDKRIELYLHQEYPLIDYINLYIPEKNKKFNVIKTGDQYIFSKRPVKYRSFVFPLTIDADESTTYYLRYESTSSMNIALILWQPSHFLEYRENESIILWIFYAVMISMFLYNLFMYSSVREISYFFYILYIATFTLFMMSLNGTAYQYLWPNQTRWGNLCIPFFMGLIIFSIIQFCRYFARIWDFTKKWEDSSLRIIMISGLILSLITLIINNYRFSITSTTALSGIAAGLGSFILIRYSVIINKKMRVRQTQFILISFMAFLTGVLLYVLKTFAVIPTNIITEYSIQIGAILEVMLLSFALADRINTMKDELLDMTQNLEIKVEKRTEELQAAMEELEAMNDHLIISNEALEKAQDIADRDMHMATTVQATLFPKIAPEVDEWDIAYVFKPKSGVSGDLYDFYEKNGSLLGLSLLDVSGHGIASGLITMIARSVIYRNILKGENDKLKKIVGVINKDLINEMGDTDNYLTGIILRFNHDQVEYVNAGHPDLLFKSGDSDKIVAVNKKDSDFKGMFLGVEVMDKPYEQFSFKIQKNDILLLYTDCLQECTNINKEQYSSKRIINSFQNAPDGSAQQVLDYILNDFYSFLGKKGPDDDLTVIVAKRTV